MIWILLTGVVWSSEPWFYPGAGPEQVKISPESTIGGLHVQRTGTVLVHAEDPASLAALPEVTQVVVLRKQTARLHLTPGTDDLVFSRILHERDDVTWAHPNLLMQPRARALPNDPYLPEQWHLQNTGQNNGTPGVDTNVELAWALTRGAGQIVAVVDTGVDTSHADLTVIPGYDYVDDDADSNPIDNAHGTASSGIIAATGDNGIGGAGVAYEAEIYGIRMLGGYTSFDDTYDAFVEAVDAGASVINNSWGFGDDCPDIQMYGIFDDMYTYAEEEGREGRGTAVVFSAGNGNCDMSNDGLQAFETVISVTATDRHDNLETYSSYGDHVDITAPSGGIITTDITGPGGYGDYQGDEDYTGTFNGTSASAPVVSGGLALMFAANPRLTAAEAREVMCQTAVRNDVSDGDYDETGWSPYYGCGRFDIGSAVVAVANEAPLAPMVTGPAPEVHEGRVFLTWDPAFDADGDTLTYKLRYWATEDPDTFVTVEDLTEPFYDLSEIATVGSELTYKVRAADLYGVGPFSEDHAFGVLPKEEPAPVVNAEPSGGCATSPPPSLWMFALAAVALRRRR
jgi:uncharacterized protein (TIGR03382 family)